MHARVAYVARSRKGMVEAAAPPAMSPARRRRRCAARLRESRPTRTHSVTAVRRQRHDSQTASRAPPGDRGRHRREAEVIEAARAGK